MLFSLKAGISNCADSTSQAMTIKALGSGRGSVCRIYLRTRLTTRRTTGPNVATTRLSGVTHSVVSRTNCNRCFVRHLNRKVKVASRRFPSVVRKGSVLLRPNVYFSVRPKVCVPNFTNIQVRSYVRVAGSNGRPFARAAGRLRCINEWVTGRGRFADGDRILFY